MVRCLCVLCIFWIVFCNFLWESLVVVRLLLVEVCVICLIRCCIEGLVWVYVCCVVVSWFSRRLGLLLVIFMVVKLWLMFLVSEVKLGIDLWDCVFSLLIRVWLSNCFSVVSGSSVCSDFFIELWKVIFCWLSMVMLMVFKVVSGVSSSVMIRFICCLIERWCSVCFISMWGVCRRLFVFVVMGLMYMMGGRLCFWVLFGFL